MSLRKVLPVLRESAEFERGMARLRDPDGVVWVEGLAGNAKWFVTAAVARELDLPCLIVTASEAEAEKIAEDLPALGFSREEIGLYPAADAGPGSGVPDSRDSSTGSNRVTSSTSIHSPSRGPAMTTSDLPSSTTAL